MNSKELIQKAKDSFNALARKGYEWKSFYNGYLIGYANANVEFKNLDLHDVMVRFSNIRAEFERIMEKEYQPQINKLVRNKDIQGLKELVQIVPDCSFKMRVYQAIVEVQNAL